MLENPQYVEGGIIRVYTSPFGMCIDAQREDDEGRITFCEDRHEFDFEMERTKRWLRGEDVDLTFWEE